LRAHLADPRQQAMYGIVHGGSSLALRRASAEYVGALPFDGVAVGGALGRDREELVHIMRSTMAWVPRHRPCHVLGIADPASVPALATLGCDTFDSCHATRAGRHGSMLTAQGPLRVVSRAKGVAGAAARSLARAFIHSHRIPTHSVVGGG
jgi:queuine tRNA-ribosyltransferase